jgi:hypothetical protein
MAIKWNIAIGAAFAASLFTASAVNAATTFEEQLSLSDGGGGTSQGYEARGPAGRRADSTGGGVSAELQAQLGLTDGGPAPSTESSGPQGRSAEGGGSGFDKHLASQRSTTDGMQ